MRVRLTEAAADDLDGISSHVALHADAVIAEHVIARIGVLISTLSAYPHIGHDGAVAGTFEMLVPRLPFVIVYRIDFNDDDNELIVLRVFHTAQRR